MPGGMLHLIRAVETPGPCKSRGHGTRQDSARIPVATGGRAYVEAAVSGDWSWLAWTIAAGGILAAIVYTYVRRDLDQRRQAAGELQNQRRAEEKIRASEEFYRKLFEANPNPMWAFDVETLRFLAVNDAAVAHYGYSRDEFLAMTIKEIRPPEDIPVLLARLAARRSGINIGGRLRHMKKDGTLINVEITSHPIEYAGHRAEIVLATDVSLQHQLDEELRQAQKIEAVGRLAGGIAHDFNNLLTVIQGYAEMLEGQLGRAHPGSALLDEITRAAGRAAELTAQLLAFSRRQMVAPRLFCLNSIVSDTEKMLRRLLGNHVDMNMELASDLGNVLADPAQVEQVLLNLAINARDAMPDGGKLTIATRNIDVNSESVANPVDLRPGSYVLLRVADTGMGMDEEVRTHLFEPFFTTKPVGQGTGLGLATVYGIVTHSGGSVTVSSTPGVGTTFNLYFPRHDAPASAADGSGTIASVKRTVLLVDDEVTVRRLVAAALRARGYAVLEASSGQEALPYGRSKEHVIDLLISDVVMPGMTGPELARKLREACPSLRVLYLSGYAGAAGTANGIDDDDFLQKPFGMDALCEKVRSLVDLAGNTTAVPAR
jgi:two-component system cell cycle sensor histidine kinase/response regulator CckA